MTFFYQSWNHRASVLPVSSEYWREGIVLYPNAKDREESLKKRAGHAILIVGWDDDKEVAIVDDKGQVVKDDAGNPVVEKGFWIFKNSWGKGSFGVANPHGDGYGYLSMKYVREYGSAYASDVPRILGPGRGLRQRHRRRPRRPDRLRRQPVRGRAGLPGQPDRAGLHRDPGRGDPRRHAAGVSSTIAVPDAGTVGSLKVTVSIDHTFRGDLKVVLTHAGKSVTVHDRAGSYEDDLDVTIDAPTFAGATLAGDWTLTVSDHAGATGTLQSWGLTVVTAR
jgi:hypothetical protein